MRSNNKRKKLSILLFIIFIMFIVYIIILLSQNNKSYLVEEIRQYNYFTVLVDNKYGVMDRTGSIIIEPVYDKVEIPNPEKGVFLCIYDYNESTDTYKTKVVNEKNEQILTQYNELDVIRLRNTTSNTPLEKGILTYKEKGLIGLTNLEGKKITKPIYEEIHSIQYKEGELVVKKDDKYGLINANGDVLIKPKYSSIACDGYYNNGYQNAGYIVQFKNEGLKYGYIDSNYKLKIKTEYNELYRINEIQEDSTYIILYKNGQAGIIKNDNFIIECQYDRIEYNVLNKLFVVKKDYKYGVINLEGKVIVPIEYDNVTFEGIYVTTIKDDEKNTYKIDGTNLNKAKFVSLFATGNEEYYISINDKGEYGIANKNEEEILKNQYKYLEYIHDSYFMITTDNKYYGILDINTNQIKMEIKYNYMRTIQYSNVIEANISQSNLTEIYNKELNKIISGNDMNIYWYEDYIKIVGTNFLKYIDLDGKELYSKEIYNENALISAVKNNKWGFIDKDENIKIDYQYDYVTEFNEYGFAGIKKDGKWGVINTTGKIVINPIYQLTTNMLEPYFVGQYYRTYTEYGEEIYTNMEE